MPQPAQQQRAPGGTANLDPKPDHGEKSYVGTGRLKGKKAVITGGDSGIGPCRGDRRCEGGRTSARCFGQQSPLERPGQPAELASVYVMLASDEASHVSEARIAVTGGTPVL